MDQTTHREEQSLQLSLDDTARLTAEAVNTVLEKLGISQTVAGIAVFPAGKGVWLVDVVMRDLSADSTWCITLTIPPVTAEAVERN